MPQTATKQSPRLPKRTLRRQPHPQQKATDQQLLDLADQDKTLSEIANALDLNPSTVYRRLQRLGSTQEDITDHRKDPSARWEEIECRALDSITDGEIKKATAYQKSTMAAIARDKINTIKGLHSSVTNLINLIMKVEYRVAEEGSRVPVSGDDRRKQTPIIDTKALSD